MDKHFSPIYREIQDRFVKIAWTQKIQEVQADIYLKKSSQNKWIIAVTSGLTSASAFLSVVTSALKAIDAEWIMPLITSVLALIASIFTIRYKDEILDDKAIACKQYAAKCRNIRNSYESLLADAKAERYTLDQLCEKRDKLADFEDSLFTGDTAPHTTSEAVFLARKDLLNNKDSQTSDEEIGAIVPIQLQ